MHQRLPNFQEVADFVLGRSTAEQVVEIIRIARLIPHVRDSILYTANLYSLTESHPPNTPENQLPINLSKDDIFINPFVDPEEPHIAYMRTLPGDRGSEFPQEALPWEEPEVAN